MDNIANRMNLPPLQYVSKIVQGERVKKALMTPGQPPRRQFSSPHVSMVAWPADMVLGS